jgi:predicted nucleic acid-binding protein
LNGSDWRLAISDWQIAGVAISHDEKAATTDNGGEIRQKQPHDRKRREDTHWREGDSDG